ncbi:MAG: hypothetical protein GY775_12180 [Candidatus Scalindua sp.]|nr:hypothetical protein [Candidatus Scalindua sp.]
MNGGIDACWEYVGTEENIDSMVDLQNKTTNAINRGDRERSSDLLLNSIDTVRTYKHVDCSLVGGEETSKKLAQVNSIIFKSDLGGFVEEEIAEIDYDVIHHHDIGIKEYSYLLDRKGLLFIDNIQCRPNDSKDYEWYKKIAIKIEKRRHRDFASGNWLVAYTRHPDTFPPSFREQFKLLSLDGKDYETERQEKVGRKKTSNNTALKVDQLDTQSIEETLFYNKTTGKFRFGDKESLPISPTSRHKVREMAEKLMNCWMAGKPCPQSEIVRDVKKKIPRSVYDNTTTIRNSLKSHLKVSMPQCSNDEYPLPSEPKYFNIVS